MTKTPPADAETSALSADARLASLDARVAELNHRLAQPPVAPSVDTVVVEQQNARILELQRLVGNLGERVAAVQAVHSRDAQFNAVVQSVDAAAAAVQRSMAAPNGPAGPAVGIGYGENADARSGSGCHDGPCGCVSCDCCTFEVWMSHVRVDHMQLEPQDTSAFLMEVWMYASIDPVNNIGVCIPDASPQSAVLLHKQITEPYGPWVTISRCIGSVAVRKGTPLTVPLTLTAVERENTPLERTIGVRDEWGSSTARLTLDCCYSSYSPILVPVALASWGQGGGNITGQFIVVKKC